LCRQRPVRRLCPALGRQICPACCGSKRLVEISCPASCGYLAAAQAHPAAVVRRQEERDTALAGAFFAKLPPAAQELSLGVLGVVAASVGDPLARLADADVVDAMAALAATYDTAARGLIYEHRPRSLLAQRLASEVRAFIEQARQQRGSGFDAEAAASLRRIGDTFGDAGKAGITSGATGCLAAVGRIVRRIASERPADTAAPRPDRAGPVLIRP
jgi:hypothetical protein